MKEALRVGTDKVVRVLHARDGYWGNALVRFLAPPELDKLKQVLVTVGLVCYWLWLNLTVVLTAAASHRVRMQHEQVPLTSSLTLSAEQGC
jgi:hypothetical protein